MKKNILLICIMLSLIGCRTVSESAIPLTQDMYKVSFQGNRRTSQDQVENNILRQSAQVTIKNGYRYFIFLAGNTTVDSRTFQTPTYVQSSYSGNYSVYGNNIYGRESGTAVISSGASITRNKYQATAIIKMLHNNKKYPNAFDASIIFNYFEPVKGKGSE